MLAVHIAEILVVIIIFQKILNVTFIAYKGQVTVTISFNLLHYTKWIKLTSRLIMYRHQYLLNAPYKPAV
jgi:hypothetical protein